MSEVIPVATPIETAAQELYRPHADVWPIADKLYGALSSHYERTCMAYQNPAKAHYLTMRGLHQAAKSPLVHIIEVETARRLLPFWQEERNLTDVLACQPTQLDEFHETLEGYAPTWLALMRAATAWSLGAAEAVIQQLETQPDHPYRGLWDLHCAIIPEFARSEWALRTFQRTDDPRQSLAGALADSWSGMTFLTGMKPYLDRLPGRPDMREIGKVILTKAESFSWAASVGREKLAKLSEPSRWAIPSVATDELAINCPLHQARQRAEDPIVHADSSSVWADSSLADGPWSPRRYCPADILHKPLTFNEQWVTEATFTARAVYVGRTKRLRPRPMGATTATELRMINLGLLAIAVGSV